MYCVLIFLKLGDAGVWFHVIHVQYSMYRYGEIVNINLVKDKKTGKPKGFCFLCYDDQRSTVLAVDNLNGIKVSICIHSVSCRRVRGLNPHEKYSE